LSSWANRKAAVQAEADSLVQAKEKALIAEQHAALADKAEADVLAELDLPNPDEMQAGDDFSAFMKSTVPDALRNRALRNLWRSNPALANVDMLVDYGEDFTGKNDPIGLVKTIYRVGKGMLPDEEESTDLKEPVSPETPEAELEETEVIKAAPLPAPEPAPALASRRRMRFDFGAGETPVANKMDTV